MSMVIFHSYVKLPEGTIEVGFQIRLSFQQTLVSRRLKCYQIGLWDIHGKSRPWVSYALIWVLWENGHPKN